MANIYENKLPDPVSPMGLAASAAGQGLFQFGEQFIKVTDRNAELEAEEIKRMALAEVDRMKTSFNQGMAIEQMDLDKAKLEETKRGNLASEEANRINQERLALDTASQIAAREAATAQGWQSLEDARDKWDDQMSLKERELKMQESRDRLAVDIAQKNWDQAEKELAFQKEKFGWTKHIDELKIEQADKSLNETIRQFDANQEIRQREIEILDARLELDTLTQDQRNEIAQEKLTIEKELAELQGKRLELDKKKEASDEAYRKATLGIAQEELQLKKDEGKWKFTTQDKYGMVCVEYHPDGTCKEQKSQVIGEEIVAINLKEPELKDIRIMQEDGTWLYGTPDGLKSDFKQAIEQIDVLLRSKNPATGTEFTVREAIEHAKKQVPEFDWDALPMLFREVRVEVGTPAAVEDTGTPVTEEGGFVSTPESIPTIPAESVTAEEETSPGRKPPVSLITPEASSGSLTDEAIATIRGY